MTIVVTGATGQVGGRLARLLVKRGIPVRALVRHRAKAAALPAAAEPVLGDFTDPASLDAAFAGAQGLFFVCLPEPAPGRLVKHDNVIAAAARAGIDHVVYLSFLNPSAASRFPQGRWHADTEAKIDGAGLPRTFLRASLYQSALVGSAGVRRGDRLLAPAGDGRIAPVAWKDIADVAAAVLTSSGHRGHAYDVTGPQLLDWTDIAQALSVATAQPILYQPIGSQEFAQLLAEDGRPATLIEGMLGLFADIQSGHMAIRSDVVRDIGAIRPTTVAQTFAATLRPPATAANPSGR